MRKLLCLLLCLSAAASAAISPGEKVPDLEFQDFQGRTTRLSDLQRSTPSGLVCLVFWCSYCESCREIEHRLDELARDLKGKAAVVGLSTSAVETPEDIEAARQRAGVEFPLLKDPGSRAAHLFGARATTTTMIVDGESRLRYYGQFGAREPYARRALEELLAGRPATHPSTPEHG